MKLTIRILLFHCVSAMLAMPLALATEPPLGIRVDGPNFRGDLVAADPSWALRFAQGPAIHEVAAKDLVLWGKYSEPARGVWIILNRGDLVVAESPRIDAEVLQAQSAIFDNLSLPLDSVAAIILHPPLDRTKRDQLLFRVSSQAGQTDRMLLANGDELLGTIAGLNDKLVTLENDAGKIEVEVARLAAVVFNPSLSKPGGSAGFRVAVGLRDGSRLTATKLATDKDTAEAELVDGTKLALSKEAIVSLQTFGGRVEYLSDMKPASYRHIPYLQLAWPYAVDRSVTGGQLRTEGKLFIKGIGMHSPSRITYDLKGAYRQFQAEVAVDEEAGQRGSVICRVFTDNGSGAWKEQASSDIIRGGTPPVPISVDLTGAKRISLLVDQADRGDELDHVDWLNARLIR